MLRSLIGLAAIAIVAVLTALSSQQGCKDLKSSWFHLSYYPIRDMRATVVLNPQKVATRAPDPQSVPIEGRDVAADFLRDSTKNPVDLATLLAGKITDPTTGSSDSSIARGERKFMKTCIPCHGISMAGDGPVAQFFVPPPDLLAEPTRQRRDGYIFSYIRHGGALMPSYGAQVTAAEAWDLIHFIRYKQKVSPR
jgi:mono/diheme cytochrome c family protein